MKGQRFSSKWVSVTQDMAETETTNMAYEEYIGD